MKKTIALVLAMMFALCAFATTAFADNETTTAATTAAPSTTAATSAAPTTTQKSDDVTDGFDSTTAAATTAAATTAASTTAAATTAAGTTAAGTTAASTTAVSTSAPDVTVTLAPGQTSYEGQDTSTTTKKPASVDTTIPSTGSSIVVPAVALLALAAGTVAVIKTKKED